MAAKSDAPGASSCRVVVVPALEDNYMYLVIDTATNEAGVVDPVDTAAIQKAARENGATIVAILTTHSHWDHAGGNIQLLKECDTIRECYGGKGDGADGVTTEVDDSSAFRIGETSFSVLFTPCHSPGHVCYVADGRHIFTGDTMFVSGCGNFNTGTAAQMTAAFDKIMALPDSTQVWVGHEYTQKNCRFACFCEPDNEDAKKRLDWVESVKSVHQGGTGTVPSTIGDERRCNPFARIDISSQVQSFCGNCTDRSERMRLVRKGKDDWGRR